ncbi:MULTISPECIES: DUF4785 domain-containing protein [Legionella]|uniref:DUF4785 domain-containing protein n=1 Tax=Legionella drozanskii LLAP-1 TaxID=1212489 RepID=A0A0W0SL74_9GAMM|nr:MULTISPECIES: DUF4785 domain-containing protein [Legionella]KTC84017.1 hypothetical protein Ldro_3137 [Legionella drozanskii LLAP-1]PJE14852.1 MAG: DUF4785 domain-containing protein [Legionella sp.]
MKFISLILLSLLCLESQAFTIAKQVPLVPYDCKSCGSLSHEELSMNWPTQDSPLHALTMHQQTSRKYQVKASLKELRRGVTIHTSAPGAIVRIAPVDHKNSVKPQFRITNKRGLNLSLLEASSLYSQKEALKNTPFAGNTLALAELKPEVGFGQFTITSPQADRNKDNELFIIHVYDRYAATALTIQTNKARYYSGDEFVATVILKDKEQNYSIDDLTMSLVSPDGDVTPLVATPIAENIFQARTFLNSEENSRGGNWYVDATVTTIIGDDIIWRQAHSAFSFTIPSAAVVNITKGPDHFDFIATVEVATGSRYALQAVLLGSDAQGKTHPIQTAQSAAWLSAGQQRLNFSFDSNLKTDYKAPYYLSYIHLTDFGQMKPVFEFDTPIEVNNLS